MSFPLPPPELEPPNSADSVELTLGAAGAGVGETTGAGAAGLGAGLGFATLRAAFFLGADLLAAFFAVFFAVFFFAAFFFGAALRRADFFAALRATFLRVTFDLVLTRAFLDFAAFFFPRFFDAFLAAIVSPLPLDRCVFERVRFPDRGELKTLARVSAS